MPAFARADQNAVAGHPPRSAAKAIFRKPVDNRSTRARIERVAQSVAEQIEGKNGEKNCQPWPDCHPRRVDQKALRGIEHAAPEGAGGCWPRPRKDSVASAMIAAAMENVACTNNAGRIFGRMCMSTMRQCGLPTAARGLDIVFDLYRHHLSARQAHEDRRRRNADRDHGIAEAWPQKSGERDGKNEKGTGQHRIGDAAEERVNEAAQITGDQPDAASRRIAIATEITPANSEARAP